MSDKARQQAILSWLAEKGYASVKELAEKVGASEEEVRQDLLELEQAGAVVRTQEGALSPEAHETPHWQREFISVAEKEALAREAARLVDAGDSLYLDASSTAWFLARRLPDIPLTVITNSLHSACAVGERSNYRVMVTGGDLVSISMSLVGPEAEAFVRRHPARWLFMSCRGFDLEYGATDASPVQAGVRRAMIESAAERVLLVDNSKLGFRAPNVIAAPNAFDRIIIDSRAEERWFTALAGAGVRVTRAEVFPKTGIL